MPTRRSSTPSPRLQGSYLPSPKPSEGPAAGAGTDTVIAEWRDPHFDAILAFATLLIVLVVVVHYVK